MSQITLNLIAIAIFAFTMLSLLGPLLGLSPAAVAIAAATCLGIVTVDRLGWQGRGGNLLIDLLSQRSADYRQRIVHHEAGHFLTAYLLEIPIQAYTLSAWEAWRAGLPGLGGVIFDSAEIEAEIEQGKISAQQLDRYYTVYMAGIAAEQQVYGSAEGGEDDRLRLRSLWRQLDRSQAEGELKLRWSQLQASNLIQRQQSAYDALVTAMTERATVETCCQAIEQHRAEAVT